MEIEWIAPNEEHPMEGYAILKEGTGRLTATISRLEWARGVDRKRVEEALVEAAKSGLDDRRVTPKILVGPRYVMPEGETDPIKGHFACMPIAFVKPAKYPRETIARLLKNGDIDADRAEEMLREVGNAH